MKSSRIALFSAALLLSATLVGCSSSTTPSTSTPTSHMIPKSTTAPYGHTWGEWSGLWWNWAVSMPVTANPLTNTAPAESGQTGNVWFIGGNTKSDTSVRTLTIPSGKALFFPILNWEADTTGGAPPVDSLLSAITNLRNSLMPQIETAEIDGVSVAISSSNFTAPTPFTVTFKANNFLGAPACTSAAYSSGDYLFVDSLSTGSHTIHFHGAFPSFAVDETYKITVN